MDHKSLINSLEFIRNKGFCSYTVHRAIKEFEEIQYYLKEEDRKKLGYYMVTLDPDYPDFTGVHSDYEWFAKHINEIIKSVKRKEDGYENIKRLEVVRNEYRRQIISPFHWKEGGNT